MANIRWRLAATIVVAIVVIAVSTASLMAPRIHNPGPSDRRPPGFGYSFGDWADSDHNTKPINPDIVIVSLSGGGIRAAAFAATTLNRLRQFKINGRSLTDSIVLISSTSGGSIAAGFLAAHGFDQYDLFKSAFLTRKNTFDLSYRRYLSETIL